MNVKYGKIGDFAKRVKVGFVGTCEKYYTEDKRYPMIRTTNLTETGIDYSDIKYVTEEFYDRNKKSQLHDGDVLIARFGTSGTACVYHGGDAQCLNAIIVEPDVENTIPEYLAIVINSRSVRDQVNKRIVGSTQAILNTKVLSDIDIVLPSLEEQKKIVDIFQSLHRICLQRTEELKSLDELVKARFVEMFGIIKDSCEVGYYIKSLTAGKSLAGEAECENKVLKTGAASFDYFDPTQVKNLPLDYEPQAEHLVRPGDIIISRMNTAELTGATAYVWDVQDNVYLPDRLWKANLKEESNPIFVWQMLIQPSTKEQIRRECSGTSGSMKNISKPGMLAIKVKKVPFELQNQFADFVKQVDKSKFGRVIAYT